MAGIGHNSGDTPAHPDVLNGVAQSQLRSIIERVERLEVEKTEILEQIKEVFAEAKGNGFDVKILRKVIAIRRMDRARRLEEEAALDIYMVAIGEAPAFERIANRRPEPEPEAAEDDNDLA
jgi:uncharacterized protein (UPF0335 family)